MANDSKAINRPTDIHVTVRHIAHMAIAHYFLKRHSWGEATIIVAMADLIVSQRSGGLRYRRAVKVLPSVLLLSNKSYRRQVAIVNNTVALWL